MATTKVTLVEQTVQRLEMDDETYFGNGLPGYISNSLMGLINPNQGGSARRFFFGFEDEAKYSAALELGSAVHALILEEDKYHLAEVSKPTGSVGPIFDTIYKLMNRGETSMEFEPALDVAVKLHDYYGGDVTGKRRQTLIEKGKPYLDFLTEYKVPGMICLTPDMKLKLTACVESVKKNRAAQRLLNPVSDEFFPIHSFNEDVIICDVDVEHDGMEERMSLKAKIDNWTIDPELKIVTLNDLKTTGKDLQSFAGKTVTDYYTQGGEIVSNEVFVRGSFQSYHYYRQMYMYGWMLWQYCKEKYGVDDTWTLNVNMVVVETNKPHGCQVFGVSKNWMQIGKQEFEELIGIILWHKKNGYDKIKEIEEKSEDFIYTIV